MTQTNLKLQMTGAHVFEPDDARLRGSTGLALRTKIWNLGTPSAIVVWSLRVTAPSQESAECAALAMPERLDLKGEPNVTLRADCSLLARTETDAVGLAPIVGYLLFYFAMAKPVILQQDSRLALTVRDVFGVSTTATQRIGDWFLPRSGGRGKFD